MVVSTACSVIRTSSPVPARFQPNAADISIIADAFHTLTGVVFFVTAVFSAFVVAASGHWEDMGEREREAGQD